MTCLRAMMGAAGCLGLVAALAMAGSAPAPAKESVSNKFDGTYEGDARVVEHLSAESCKPFTTRKVVIRGGQLRSEGAGPSVSAIVVTSGFLTGGYWSQDGQGRLEGLIDDDALIAGAGSRDETCFWMLELTRR